MIPCPVCQGTGEVDQMGYLDCVEPGCTAAVERRELNEKIAAHRKEHGRMTEYDLAWFCYRAGKEAK